MLKNKFKVIALLIAIVFILMAPIVRAEDNEAAGQTTTENQAVIDGAEEQATQSAISQDNYKEGDVYLTGDEVTIDYIVDGNLFVFANTVNITSQIGGDAFIFAKTVNVSNTGYIFSNLFTLATNVNINGMVYDLYASSDNVNISGYVYRDIRVSTNNFSLSGVVGRNAYLQKVNNIQVATNEGEENTVTSQGSINGDLNYSAKQELSIPDGIVTGNINYTPVSNSSASIQSYLLALGRFLVTVIVIWLLCLWLAPKFLNRTDLILTKKLPSTIGFGILTPIVILFVAAILLLLGIAGTIGGLGIVILFVACAISTSIFIIAINNLICKKLHVEKTIGKFGILIIAAAVLWLIALIPYVGGVISIIAAVLGLGLLVNGILPSNRNKDFSVDKKDTSKENKSKTEDKAKTKSETKTEKPKKEQKDKKSKKENKENKENK